MAAKVGSKSKQINQRVSSKEDRTENKSEQLDVIYNSTDAPMLEKWRDGKRL